VAKLISLKLEEKILKEVDKQVKTGLYSSRTDFIRDAIRQFIERKEMLEHLKHRKVEKAAAHPPEDLEEYISEELPALLKSHRRGYL
jgi:Arc/MetJ-type ribon-helix-helix transcriptional regulator